MAIGVKDKVLFQLSINDVEIPLDQNTLDYFHLVESVRLRLPAMTVQIQDATKFFSKKNLLVDGATIRVTLGIDGKKLVFPMRYFTHKESLSNGNPTFKIFAYLDVPLFWTSSMVETINGTASTALMQICQKTGLTYEGISTNDSQLWIPYNRKFRDFAKYIAGAAYVNEGSCVQMGVSFIKRMIVKNVTDFDKFMVMETLANMPGSGQLTIADYKVLNKSGFYNTVSGYKDQTIIQSNLREDETIKDARVKKNSTKLMMNEGVRTSVGQNRVTHAPIDAGNVNENYTKGKYQNERLANLFSSGLEIVSPNFVNADLLDVISAQISRPGADNISTLSGKYMVTSRVFYLSNNNFAQKIEVYRHGLNDKRDSGQS